MGLRVGVGVTDAAGVIVCVIVGVTVGVVVGIGVNALGTTILVPSCLTIVVVIAPPFIFFLYVISFPANIESKEITFIEASSVAGSMYGSHCVPFPSLLYFSRENDDGDGETAGVIDGVIDGDGVTVDVTVGVIEAVGVGVGADVFVGLGVGSAVLDGVAVGDADAVTVGVGERVGVWVGVGRGLLVGVQVLVVVGVGVGDGLGGI